MVNFNNRPDVPVHRSSRVSLVHVWLMELFVVGWASSRTLLDQLLLCISSEKVRDRKGDVRYRGIRREMRDVPHNVLVCQIVRTPRRDCLFISHSLPLASFIPCPVHLA